MNSCDNCKGDAPMRIALASTATGAIIEIGWCPFCGCAYVRNADGWDIYVPEVSAPRNPEEREIGSPWRLAPRVGRTIDNWPCPPDSPDDELVSLADVVARAHEDARTRSTLVRPDCTGCEAAGEEPSGIGWCANHGQVRLRDRPGPRSQYRSS